MKKVELKVRERESFGSAEARRLRKNGWVPGVLYGKGKGSIPLSVEEKALRKALGQEGTILTLAFEGKKREHPAILKEFQGDPVGGGVLHVDFMEVRMDQPVEATVRLELTGSARGVREGGIMEHTLRELHVRCLPVDIPEVIQYDVENMAIGDSIKVSDLTPPDKVEILNDPETQIASVMPPALVKEEKPAEELEEEAAAAAGEGAAGEEKPGAGGKGEAGAAE